MLGFTLGRPTRESPRAPRTTALFQPQRATAPWILPKTNTNRPNESNNNPKLGGKKRSNFEWRLQISTIYSSILKTRQTTGKKATLHNSCEISDYKRLSPIWKQLKLDKFLKNKTPVDDVSFTALLDQQFPLTGDEAVIPKPSRAKKPKLRRTDAEWNSLLIDMYTALLNAKMNNPNEVTMKSYMNDVLQLPAEQNCRIYKVWKELGLNEALDTNVSSSDKALLDRINNKYPVENNQGRTEKGAGTRNCTADSSSYFDKEEEAMLCALVAGLARMGFPMDKANLQDLCNAYLKVEDRDCLSENGVSIATIERIYKHGAVSAKDNVNPIDPKRAAQAEPNVLNTFYHQLDETIKILHELDPVTWPEDRYANIPPTRIYNCDEQGPNPTKLRSPVLIPVDMIQTSNRLFQNTREGDGKMAFHYSVANIVRADGIQCIPHEHIEGAPAPFILVSDAGSSEDLDSMDKASRDKVLANQSVNDLIELPEAVLEGWFDKFVLGNKESTVNQFGFQIRATPSGSMLKRTFFDFLLHFVSQLPHDQGPGGQGCVLHLDWHSSRECPQSLLTALLKYNVFISVLPSKSSIWSQPCDNGKNELTAKAISKAGHDLGMLNGKPLDYYDANRIFRIGLETNCHEQNDELRRTGSNAVVSSFAKTGLCPMSYDNEGWNNAFYTFGKLNGMMRKQRLQAGERIPHITWVVKAKPIDERGELTAEETKLISSFLARDDFLALKMESPLEIPVLLMAMAIAERLLGTYNQDPQQDMSKPPEPQEQVEIAALKIVHFVGITVNDRVDTTCTLSDEKIAVDKLRSKLALLPFGQSIQLVKRSTDLSKRRIVSITKQGENKFIRLDGDRRQSRNFDVLTTSQVLNSYAFDDECQKHESIAHPLTADDKKKSRKKERIKRKKRNEVMSAEAIQIANERRHKRNRDAIEELMTKTFSTEFVGRLDTMLEEEGSSMDQFHNLWEETLLEPYTDTITVSHEDDGKEYTADFDVTRIGSDVSAVSHRASVIFLELFHKLKTQQGNKRRKRRRGPGQSTHLGKPGYIAGILIQRAAQQDEKEALEKKKKSADDEVSKLRSVQEMMEEIKREMPTEYWLCDKLKGKKRTALAKLFDIWKSSMKALDVEQAIRSLNLSKATVDGKLQELKSKIESKEAMIPTIIAEIRDCDDFIAGTKEYDETAANESDADDIDEVD